MRKYILIFNIFILAGFFTCAIAQSPESAPTTKKTSVGTTATQTHIVTASKQTARGLSVPDVKTEKRVLPVPTGNAQIPYGLRRPDGQPETK